MTARPAPRAATWLLEILVSEARAQPLIGDLAEQFADGRSRAWYWRQAFGALGIQLLGALRTHGPSFVAAILAGGALTWLLELCCSLAFQPVYQNLAGIKLHPWSSEALLRLAGMVANTVFWCVLCFLSAWVVTRVHRAHQRGVLVAFVLVQIAQRVPDIVPLVLAVKDTNTAIALATQIILTGYHAVFTLLAGLWAIQTRRITYRSRWLPVVTLLWAGQVVATTVFFAARRVGEVSYARPEGYLSMYAIGIFGGVYLAFLLWPASSSLVTLKRPA